MRNCDLRLENAALGLPPGAAFSRPRSQVFSIRTSLPVNKEKQISFQVDTSLKCLLESCGQGHL